MWQLKVTVSPVSQLHCYLIPKIEDTFATLEGGKIFTKLDLSLPAIEAGCCVTKVSGDQNSQGALPLYRLLFGISSATGISRKQWRPFYKEFPMLRST